MNTTGTYTLLDTGEGEKLEQYGDILLSRPDPQALWPKRLANKEWERADASFTRDAKKAEWVMRKKLPERWQITHGGVSFWIRPTAFKHTGVFPEQAFNWEWIRRVITGATREVSVLNLFGYTGGATIAVAQAGARVTHVDGSKVAIGWARDNAALSGVSEKPVRWMLDDAVAFVKREIRRGNTYDGIILDPPAFGHGPNKEMWRIEKDLVPLLAACKKMMAPQPLFFLLNGYASGYSAIAYENNLTELFGKNGHYERGELTIQEKPMDAVEPGRLLPCGIYARWSYT